MNHSGCFHVESAICRIDKELNHKNYNFLDCDWFKKKLLFSTKFTCQVVIGQFACGQFVIGRGKGRD